MKKRNWTGKSGDPGGKGGGRSPESYRLSAGAKKKKTATRTREKKKKSGGK